jgi:metal-responsive CopG/Arc/MetJ family transcriptional regulator
MAWYNPGYTLPMKTAVSITDELFVKAEKLAKRRKISRSRLYSQAIEEYLAKDEKRRIIEQINKVCDEVDSSLDPRLRAFQADMIRRNEW